MTHRVNITIANQLLAMKIHRQSLLTCILAISGFILMPLLQTPCFGAASTVIVTAEGLADPEADMFQNDKGLLVDALLDDAKKQAIEKVVGMYVDSRSLVENYELVQDRVLTQTRGLIKSVISKTQPHLGDDGFMHMTIKAEVYSKKTEESLREMSGEQRVALIREYGNPRIGVKITVRDAQRGSKIGEQRSDIAENIVKAQIKDFGFRIWSDKSKGKGDFFISGEVKFKPVKLKLKTSGVEINRVTITSWTISCMDENSGEEIYFNNKLPKKRSWSSEDEAVAAVGEMIGQEFSKDFFQNQLLAKTQIYQVEIRDVGSYDFVELFKNELIGLRPVLNVELRSFEDKGSAFFEIEFSSSSMSFTDFLSSGILKPLNTKFGKPLLSLAEVRRQEVKIGFKSKGRVEKLYSQVKTKPPSSLAQAAPERINKVAAT
ncbi:MAG: hypothetical protein ABFS19_06705, partial [Thermodesulfobacteriota bacterium]